MDYNLSRYERETVIVYNEAEPDAELYTCSPQVMRKMDAIVAKDPRFTVSKEDETSKTYIFPKRYAKIHKPPSGGGFTASNSEGEQ